MSRTDVGRRRLDLQAALSASLRGLPDMWRGAGVVLALSTAAWLVPAFARLADGEWAVWASLASLASLAATGALARLAISTDTAGAKATGLGPGGLQFGKPEARLLGAGLLCLIFLAMIVVVLALVVLAIFGTADLNVAAIQARDWSRVGEPWKLGLLGALGVVAVAVPLMLAGRLSLFVPATIGRGHMVSLNSMSLTSGSVASFLAGLILTSLPKIALLTLIGLGVLQGPVAAVVGAIVLVGLQLPLTLGFLGAAYRALETWTPMEPKA